MSRKHEISCWQCNEMTSLETRNEFDGCCWACGVEIDLEDYLIKAMDKRDEHYAALSAVTAERDDLRLQVEAARSVCTESQGAILGLIAERDQLRAEAEALRVALLGIALVNPAERGIEWAKAYASDGLSGTGSELYIRWLETFKEAEALRPDAERYRWLRDLATAQDIRYPLMGQPREVDKTIDAAMAAKEE